MPQLSLAAGAGKLTIALVTPAATFVRTLAHGPMTGGVVSTTMICALQVLEAPLLSKTVNMMLLVPVANGPAGLSDRLVIVPSLSKEPASTATAATVAWQLASALTVILLHTATGGWLGAGRPRTTTWKVHGLVLAAESVAVHVTVLVPRAKALPDAGEELVVTVPQLSLAVGAPKAMFTWVWGRAMLVTISATPAMTGR